jgi:lysyl-tRNA synthetase class 2
VLSDPTPAWRPACSLELLRRRAELLAGIRAYFAKHGVLEVETPLLSHATVTDPHLSVFTTSYKGREPVRLYLQTSPEFAMKRLLAAGSGSIYQICKAFRNEELGRLHSPEFTLLEWYRVGFDLDDLIADADALLQALSHGVRVLGPSEKTSYRQVFFDYTGIDPIEAPWQTFIRCAREHSLPEAVDICGENRSLWLDFFFSHLVQPHLGVGRFTYVMDFPAALPSLARNKPGDDNLVQRAEVFLDGLELGNGFFELTDAEEQERRFDRDLAERSASDLLVPGKDRRLLAALAAGLPDCAGMALGIDRLLVGLYGLESVGETLAFPFAIA